MLASVHSIGFFFFFLVFDQGPIRDKFSYRLVPLLQTITTFYPFIQIERNQRPLLLYDLLYPVKQLKLVFEILKFELDQI